MPATLNQEISIRNGETFRLSYSKKNLILLKKKKDMNEDIKDIIKIDKEHEIYEKSLRGN